jgi:ATP-dependent DNA helicase RecG
MVDTAGGGIRKMFWFQRQRFFPLPDYELSPQRVQVTLTGKVINRDYSRLLASNADLRLEHIVALDKVQKGQRLNSDEEKMLKHRKLIEGRKPHFHIAKTVAQQTGQKASYSKTKGFEKQYYLDLICKALSEHESLTRRDIDELLWNKLPEWMDEQQRKYKVGNLLGELKRKKNIVNTGTTKYSVWILVK